MFSLFPHQECSSSAHAQMPTFTAVYQLSGWIKAWFILFDYLVLLSGMDHEQRCPGSTVISKRRKAMKY